MDLFSSCCFVWIATFPSRFSSQFNLTKRTQFRDVLQEMRNTKKLRRVKKAASEDKPQAGVTLVAPAVDFTSPLCQHLVEKQETLVWRQIPPNEVLNYLAGFTRGTQRLPWWHLSECLDVFQRKTISDLHQHRRHNGGVRPVTVFEWKVACRHIFCSPISLEKEWRLLSFSQQLVPAVSTSS